MMKAKNTPLSRPRVLQASYACDPVSSMEARLSWHRAVQSAREFDTWVICQGQQFDCMGRPLPPRPKVDGLTIVETPPVWENVNSEQLGLFYYAYHLYQKRVLKVARQLEQHHQIPFDIVHQVSFCGYREPGYLWKMEAPFIWGPVGGTQNFPSEYFGQINVRGAVTEKIRSVINNWQLRHRRRVRMAARNAAHVFAANSTAQRDLANYHGVDAELQLETGLERLPDAASIREGKNSRLRILWSGRFCHWKALPLLLRALAPLRGLVDFELRVMGHGPEESRWRKLVTGLGLSTQTQFVPWPTYEDQLDQYAWADVFAFTSLRDTSGTGLLEALAHGCPVIAVDHQGAHNIVTDESGIRVPVSSPTETIEGFQNAISDLATDGALRNGLSRGARQRAENYRWDNLGKRMLEVYRDVIGRPENSPPTTIRDEAVIGIR